jgi:hypothetical protein
MYESSNVYDGRRLPGGHATVDAVHFDEIRKYCIAAGSFWIGINGDF